MERKERTHRAPGRSQSTQIGKADPCVKASLVGLSVVLLAGGLMIGLSAMPAAAAGAQPFKLTNIHFETNASACDMGVQIKFDTDGVTTGMVKDPTGPI